MLLAAIVAVAGLVVALRDPALPRGRVDAPEAAEAWRRPGDAR